MTGRNVYEILEYTHFEKFAWNAKIQSIRNSNSKASLAIDDFGTGENNDPMLLEKYNPDIVKIDRQFISGIDRDEEKWRKLNRMIIEIRMHSALILAEGVETEGEYKCLLKMDIDLMQGYYLGKPKIYETA
jgi:EAL domain-containing protein (putative c-di-GMP-specific phosphodiesterase class I)